MAAGICERDEASKSAEKAKRKKAKKEKKVKKHGSRRGESGGKEGTKKKRKRERGGEKGGADVDSSAKKRKSENDSEGRGQSDGRASLESKTLPFDCQYILAPMVGASELAFRLLCRKYGAQLAYTPMMSSTKFATDATYRADEFQTVPEDRPLVCHFSANDPGEFAAAARLVEDRCDAIDLNLGCPQRTAYVGHFGSYLLDEKDRELVLDIVREGSRAVSIPIFVKIRLLNTPPDTIELCRQLRDAGASLIAVHARYRASFERKGAGARDGAAHLDQVAEIKKAVPGIAIIANGNVINYGDVEKNLELTKADGIMSAEGILDKPALYLPRWGTNDDAAGTKVIAVSDPSPLPGVDAQRPNDACCTLDKEETKRKRKIQKRLKEIVEIEKKGAESINATQKKRLDKKLDFETELRGILEKEMGTLPEAEKDAGSTEPPQPRTKDVLLKDLYETAEDELELALEYLDLARRYPVKIRSVVFHTRRICKGLLKQYQLLEDCVACKTNDEVRAVLRKMQKYREDPESFRFDRDKATREKEALEKKKREEGKRKAYEARMMRKAKREGKTDLEYYLRIGAELPTVETIERLRSLSKEEQLAAWKVNHSQHCLSYHLDQCGCKRDRTCAFLHIDAKGVNTFDESEEVAG